MLVLYHYFIASGVQISSRGSLLISKSFLKNLKVKILYKYRSFYWFFQQNGLFNKSQFYWRMLMFEEQISHNATVWFLQ